MSSFAILTKTIKTETWGGVKNMNQLNGRKRNNHPHCSQNRNLTYEHLAAEMLTNLVENVLEFINCSHNDYPNTITSLFPVCEMLFIISWMEQK